MINPVVLCRYGVLRMFEKVPRRKLDRRELEGGGGMQNENITQI